MKAKFFIFFILNKAAKNMGGWGKKLGISFAASQAGVLLTLGNSHSKSKKNIKAR